ncbi:Beta-catenin homolog sys-1 [Caenorhabditis elegans]|nr:SYmmetrical Sister cell hermaphrodite gonad defect [Caenorhabditis elegans]CTQ86377.1 SYmmetrical Sister cell hermaphrodite gonad defect [Caenorhabditis elegans]|eukprot:NP_001300438.1 SYmmetrical Sister cell hermaphrodite gonad defect [Caenorhabditis elegans]
MSYHQGDDRMSMLSVNTTMTNQFPDSQRCYSSNGSTCENVNPEMMQMNITQAAEQAIRLWFNTPDPMQRLHMAKTIRTWIRQDKFAQVDQANMPNCVQQILNIIYDGLKPQPVQLPISYYAQLWYNLLDILRRFTFLPIISPYIHQVVQMFCPRENGPQDFRELICNLISLNWQKDPHMKHCANQVFQIFNCIIMGVKNEKLRTEFAQHLKFEKLVGTLSEYFNPQVHPGMINPAIFIIFRFIISKDTRLKDYFIWNNNPHDQPPPPTGLIIKLNAVMIGSYRLIAGQNPETLPQNPELAHLIQVIIRTFDLLGLLLHDSDAIDGFVRSDGVGAITTVVQYPNNDLIRAGCKLLLQVSDAKALAKTPLENILPFLLRLIEIHPDDEVIYSGTGFLSNVVAHKQHVKDIAIRSNAIFLLHTIISKYPRLDELTDAPKRNRVCEIICNCLRTLNNFLMMWIPTPNGETKTAGPNEKQQVCKFIEIDILKKLMSCLSCEGMDTPGLLELRSTILRSFILLLRTPFVPKDGVLNVIDENRKENLIGHICAAYSWVFRQPNNTRTQSTKQQLVERTISLLLVLMEQCGAEKEVAQYSYSIDCPLNLLNGNQVKPTFIHNVLVVCDKILEHCPTRADIWTIDRPMLEGLTNHRNSDIAKAANSLLSRFPENDLLAGIFSNREYF